MFQAAERVGLDPYLVAAIVREESSYYPRAVSRAGARGLMQLMPGTAQPMAEVRGWAFRDGALLDEPAANIEMGTAFLAGLVREFRPRIASTVQRRRAARATGGSAQERRHRGLDGSPVLTRRADTSNALASTGTLPPNLAASDTARA